MTGRTSSSRRVELTIPPTIGAAIRFMTSALAPDLQRIGTNPAIHRNTSSFMSGPQEALH